MKNTCNDAKRASKNNESPPRWSRPGNQICHPNCNQHNSRSSIHLEKNSRMQFKKKLLLWLLRHKRPSYLKFKHLDWLAIGRDNEFWDLHARLLQDDRGSQLLTERYNLYSLAKATSRLPGALAEAGVYRGAAPKSYVRTGKARFRFTSSIPLKECPG